jgi:elongator complex protein 1
VDYANYLRLLYTRFVETGAKISQVKWKSACVVMELPRGSLEMVYPQFLLRSSIQNDILHHRYDSAFRKGLLHRIDVNDLLIRSLSTHPENLACFLAKLSKKQHIENFVLGLK